MDNYNHKKFTGALKRKRCHAEESDDDVVFIMEQCGNRTPEQPQPKRRFFRPWLDESVAQEQESQTTRSRSPASPPLVDATSTYHANMVRSHTPRQRSPQEQLRRDRNTLASLRHRRHKQQEQALMEQQYLDYRRQHEANLQQQVRLSLYYVRFLQQTMAATREPLHPSSHQQMPRAQATTQHSWGVYN
ncbi:protein Mabiki [Drosophila subobscura]|uniref:protein Mabiki n=1 Tax=Drosophila subobscura TaxID=7241 RepID=UPI00155B0A00|nr:protein Mabiki [Drosophila subobscura]